MDEKKYLCIDDAYDLGTLTDWYISSVDDSDPVWTDAHLEELHKDFYLIPKCAKTVNAAPLVHGHWVQPNNDDQSCNNFVCSACGHEIFHPTDVPIIEPFPKYCEECGAKMDEVTK